MQTHVSEAGHNPHAWLYGEETTHRAPNDCTALLAIVRRASMTVSDKASGQALGAAALRLGAGGGARSGSAILLSVPLDGGQIDQ